MNNKVVKGLALALGAALCLTACGGGDEEVTSVLDDGVLTVAVMDGQDAYARKEGDTFVGIEPTLVEAYAGAMEAETTYVECATQAEALSLLDAGEVDLVMARIGYTSAYDSKYDTTKYYGKSGLYLVSNKNVFVDNLAMYTDLQVGMSVNVPVHLVGDIPGIGEVVQLNINDMSTVPSMLQTAVIAGAVCTEREAFALLEGGDVQAMQIAGDAREGYVAFANKGQGAVINGLNNVIESYLNSLAVPAVETPAEEG